MVKVSIIMPVYNEENNIDKCLLSIFNQTFKNYEIICINDGSTDATHKKLLLWQRKFNERLKIIKNPNNLGFTKSLNIGLKTVTTSWTARIDADDYWDNRKLEIQMNYLKNNSDIGLIGCQYINYINNKQKKVFLPLEDKEIKDYLPKGNPFGHSCVVFKTELVKKLGGYDQSFYPSDDYRLWSLCAKYTKMHNCQELLVYRQLGDGISIVGQNKQLRQSLRIQSQNIRILRKSYLNYIHLLSTLFTLLTPGIIRKIKRLFII